MNGFCPNCQKETNLTLIQRIEEINIRGEIIPVDVEYYHCEVCGEDFDKPRQDYDPLETAYREYRQRKGMVQPEEIRQFRKRHGLTQKEMSELLGIGIATLNRYENGALQSEAHDHVLRFSMKPENLYHLIEEKPQVLSEESKQRIISEIEQERTGCGNLLDNAIERFGSYEPDIRSGYVRFDVNKMCQVIKFFCFNDRVFKTKLMKLLFYADFKHYKENGISITGARYAHATHGPVPDQFETWLAALSEWEKEITVAEQAIGEYLGEVYLSKEPDLSTFSNSELLTLATIKNMFSNYSAKQIREYSHQEKGYVSTKDGELISYQYAEELRI